MAIYRGPGGPGDATGDSANQAQVAETFATQAGVSAAAAAASATTASNAATAAQAAQAAAETAETNAETAETNAETAEANAETAQAAAEAAQAAAEAARNLAEGYKDDAETAATTAENAAISATTSANAASSSASSASSSASSASSSASAAASSASSAAASFDSFDDRYLGAKSSDPTLDNDGNALLTGALYFNTTNNTMKVYTGSAWVVFGGGDVVSDTTPQLGGALDTNGYAINFGDNDKATFGDSEDLWIYHDGGSSYLFDRGTGNLRIITNSTVSIDGVSGGEFMAQFVSNGAVSLYYDNSKKIETTSTGVSVTGNIAVSGTVDGVDIATGATNWDTAYGWGDHASAGYITDVVSDTSPQLGGDLNSNGNDILVADNDAIIIGSGSDLKISHSSSTNISTIETPYSLDVFQIKQGTRTVFQAAQGNGSLFGGTSVRVKATDTGVELYQDVSIIDTGAIKIPVGTEAQRPASPAAGQLRFNNDADEFEGYNGTAWAPVGGGNSTTNGLWENSNTISANYTIGTNFNAMSAGPVTIDSGVTVTVPTGSRWVVI